MAHISRRRFLQTSLGAGAGLVLPWSLPAVAQDTVIKQHATFGDYPFQLGVASGDPSPDGVVLWTRLATKPLEGGGMPADAVEVSWQVAADEKMSKVVRQGKATASPEWAHSVHVEVDGLEPGRWYWYRFQAGGEASPIARTRTMPPGDSTATDLRFAFASCQNYEQGLFTAYEHMAKEELDLVVHLGDYIYEAASRDGQVRKHVGPLLNTLDDYRNRHAQYRTDAHLQSTHAAFPWIVTWDDHEFADNYAAAIAARSGTDPQEFLKRRANAYRAYYEHMPLRRSSLAVGPDLPLYRRLSWGKLAEFFVLDTRQYRTDQPCGDGNKPPCEAVYDPTATILGDEQEKWLHAGLADSRSPWNILAQQVMMARVDKLAGENVGYSMDQWPGYEVNRRRLLKFFHERKISNPVVLGGDIHSNWANNLIADFDDLDSKCVATEFVGTSISSGGNGVQKPRNHDTLLAENPFVKFHNAERGYVRCRVTPKQWQSDYQMVEYVTRPGAPLVTRVSFVIESGHPELQRA